MTFAGTLVDEAGNEVELVLTLRDGELRGTRNGEPVGPVGVRRAGNAVILVLAGTTHRAVVARDGDRVHVHCGGRVRSWGLDGGGRRRGGPGARRQHGGDEPFAASPMTGVVVEVPVKPGDVVEKGGTLAVVEAMKMQFVVRAPRDVVVAAVKAAPGASVDIGQVLVEFAEGGE